MSLQWKAAILERKPEEVERQMYRDQVHMCAISLATRSTCLKTAPKKTFGGRIYNKVTNMTKAIFCEQLSKRKQVCLKKDFKHGSIETTT